VNRRTAAWSMPAPTGAHRNAVRRSSIRAGHPAETRRGVLRQTAPCWTTVVLMPAAAARAGGLSATQGAVIPRQGREGGANEARRVITRLCACRNAVPVDLAQRGARLFVEPRQAGKEVPTKPAASSRANGVTATQRAASRRTAPCWK